MEKRVKHEPPKADDEFEAFEEWHEGAAEDRHEEEGGFAQSDAAEGSPAGQSGFLDEGLDDFQEDEIPAEAPENNAADEGAGDSPAPSEHAAGGGVQQRPQKASDASGPKAPRKFERAAFDLAPDVPVQVVAVMGKRGLTIKELMEFRLGQVIDLKRPPNESVDIVVNGKLFARGELVEIDGKLGAKIIQLMR